MLVCPRDCILEHHPPSGSSELPNQLFIDPDECIDSNVCVAECPWEAIYYEQDVLFPGRDGNSTLSRAAVSKVFKKVV